MDDEDYNTGSEDSDTTKVDNCTKEADDTQKDDTLEINEETKCDKEDVDANSKISEYKSLYKRYRKELCWWHFNASCRYGSECKKPHTLPKYDNTNTQREEESSTGKTQESIISKHNDLRKSEGKASTMYADKCKEGLAKSIRSQQGSNQNQRRTEQGLPNINKNMCFMLAPMHMVASMLP